jgi:hypothetical protein
MVKGVSEPAARVTSADHVDQVTKDAAHGQGDLEKISFSMHATTGPSEILLVLVTVLGPT